MKRNGFSLAELAIVIVIISLLVAGVLVGKDLISSSKVNTIIKDLQKYDMAVVAFRDKYGDEPGDISNATFYFGGGNVSDGNGDGAIQGYDDGAGYMEEYYVWQHLSFAGFIDGKFTGSRTGPTVSGTTFVNIGNDVPAAPCEQCSYRIRGYSIIALGATSTISPYHQPLFSFVALTPSEADSIDRKMDDGIPTSGKVIGGGGNGGGGILCNSSTEYNLVVKTRVCMLYYYTRKMP